jgi:hypothetical protein
MKSQHISFSFYGTKESLIKVIVLITNKLTTSSRVILEKLEAAQLVKNFQMKAPGSSLPCSQETATGPYAERGQSSP